MGNLIIFIFYEKKLLEIIQKYEYSSYIFNIV